MSNKKTVLEKLEEKQRKLNEQIKLARKEQAKKEALIYEKKCTLIGSAILKEIENNSDFENTINPIIDKYTVTSKNRKILGLTPSNKKI